MKYIESTPLPDGTYDHTEVRAAYDRGSIVEFCFLVTWRGCDPCWDEWLMYRAQVPDTYGIHESSSTLREVKADAGPSVAEMLLDRIKELEYALSEIIEEDIQPNIVDVMTNKERKIIDIARAALNKEPK